MALLNINIKPLNAEEWVLIEKTRDALNFFDEITIEMSSEKNITISKVILLVKALRNHIRQLSSNIDLPLPFEKFLFTASSQIADRFSLTEDKFLYTDGTFLDPRFKNYGFSDASISTNVEKQITKKAAAIHLEEPESQVESLPRSSATSSIWDAFDNRTAALVQSDRPSAAAIIEVKRYLQEPLLQRSGDPLLWWKVRQNVYPRLFELVKKKLCVIATSVPSERVFSKAGQTITEKRCRLTTKKAEKLIFLNFNLDK